MSSQITSGSRISDLIDVLSDPIGYVDRVIGNFIFYGYDPETSAIRIGVKGSGIAPNYKIEAPSIPSTLKIGTQEFAMTETSAHTFNGRNHWEMTQLDDLERRDENWSTHTMGFAELKALLSNLLQSKMKH